MRRFHSTLAVLLLITIAGQARAEEAGAQENGAVPEEEAPPPAAEGEATAGAPGAEAGAPGAEAGVPAAEPSAEDAALEAARRHFRQGLLLVRREAWAAALAEFDASIAARPNQSALFNRALCLRELGDFQQAIEALEEYRERARAEGGQDERLAEVERRIAEIRELVTEVTVTVNVDGARITVDGEAAGLSPLRRPLLLLSGPHLVTASYPGYRAEEQEVPVVSGEPRTVVFELEQPPPRGEVRVLGNVPGADVYIDGVRHGDVPFRGVLDAGEHEIEVRADRYRPEHQTVRVEADDQALVNVTMSRLLRAHRAWFWSLVGLTAASTLTTIGLGSAVVALDGEYEPSGPDSVDGYERGGDLMLGTDVALGVSLASAAAALVLYFFTDFEPPPAAAATPAGAEARLRGSPAGIAF